MPQNYRQYLDSNKDTKEIEHGKEKPTKKMEKIQGATQQRV